MRDLIELAGAIAGLAAFLGLAVLALLYFAQARDVRRLREWAGGAPERDAGLSEATSEVAAQRADELQRLEQERERKEEARRAEERAAALREQRRERRERGLPEETRWERVRNRVGGGLPAARYLALIAGAVIVLGTGVAVLALGVLNDDSNGGGSGNSGSLRPSDIEVAVLNGTALSGLAGRTGDKLERDGFELGAVTNSPSSFSTSVVMYTRGRRPEARRVGRDLSIRETRLMTDEVAAAAAGAPVAVVIGEDRAGSPET